MDTHLSEDEIQEILKQGRIHASSESDTSNSLDARLSHLATCTVCRESMDAIREFNINLSTLRSEGQTHAGPDCP